MRIVIIAGICTGIFFLLALILLLANRGKRITNTNLQGLASVATVLSTSIGLVGLLITVNSALRIGEKCLENVEIVLDCSVGMSKGVVGGGTKYDKAIVELERILYSFSDSDNLAFRRFGGPSCDAGATALLVEFGKKNRDEILETASNQVLDGQASLARAVIEATGDFNDPAKFEGMRNRITVILGSGSFCSDDPSQLIRERLQNRRDDIEMSFSFIGDSIPVSVRDALSQIGEETEGPTELREVQQTIPDDVSERIGTVSMIDREIIDGLTMLVWRAEESDNVLHTMKLEKILSESEPEYDYYVVTTVATQKHNPGLLFRNTVRFWALSEQESTTRCPQVISFLPGAGAPGRIPFTVDMPGMSVSFETDSPGAWVIDRRDCGSGKWECSEIVWTMPFELTYCWKELRTVSIWRAPANEQKVLEIDSSVITATGGCNFISTNKTTANTMNIRVDISELERELGEP